MTATDPADWTPVTGPVTFLAAKIVDVETGQEWSLDLAPEGHAGPMMTVTLGADGTFTLEEEGL